MNALIAALVAAAIAWTAIAVLARLRASAWLVDRPNERSLHSTPRARVGGLGIVLGVAAIAPWFAHGALLASAACAAALAVVSLMDDVRSLPVWVRLTAHLGAAIVAVASVAAADAMPLGIVFTLCIAAAIAWMTNLFNFMDGADGLAGGMAMIGFGCFAAAAALTGEAPLALACAAVAGAAAGFLPHNFPPARVFMGDAGSIPLGFLAGALGLHGSFVHAWPAWFPVLVFSPFIVDATYTVVRRAARMEPVWRAHRNHCYQRLVLVGWTHRRLALAAYAMMIAVAASALAGRAGGPLLQCGIIAFWAAAYALLLLAIERYLRRNTGGSREPPGARSGTTTKRGGTAR